MIAALLLDLLWPLLVLSGYERVHIEPGNTAFTPLKFVYYPISHSLLAAIGWATVFALLYLILARYKRGAVVVWFGVVSHWILDFITHRPDLPLYPGGPLVGLSLWNSPAATVLLESAMYAAGIWIYVRVTRARDRIGKWAFWSFAVTVAAFYVLNIFSPPPPNVHAIVMVATVLVWLLILWSWWADRHREPR